MSTFKVGDRVVYKEGDEDAGSEPGTVKEVIKHTTYEYVVEWDDNDPTDTYFDDQLAQDSGLVEA